MERLQRQRRRQQGDHDVEEIVDTDDDSDIQSVEILPEQEEGEENEIFGIGGKKDWYEEMLEENEIEEMRDLGKDLRLERCGVTFNQISKTLRKPERLKSVNLKYANKFLFFSFQAMGSANSEGFARA